MNISGKFYQKTGLLSLVFLCIFFMSACAKAPERTEENSGTEMELDLSSEQYVTLQEAKEQAERLRGKNIRDFYFPEYISLPEGDKISDLKLTPWYPGEHKELPTADGEEALQLIKDDMEEVIKNIWADYDTIDWASVTEKKLNLKYGRMAALSKEDQKTGFFYDYDARGFFAADSLNDTELDLSGFYKEYNFLWEDTVSGEDVYPLEDGEISVSEAVRYTEHLFNSYVSKLESSQFQYKVQRLYAVKNKDTGYYDFNIIIGRLYQGISMDVCSDYEILTPGRYYDKVHSGDCIRAVMRHKEKLDFVASTELLRTETETEAQKVISPLWAVSQMDEEIAHIGGMAFSNCGLVYLLMQDNPKLEEKEQGFYGGVDETSYLRPVWLFATSAEGGTAYFSNRNHGASIIVDALDGTIYYYEGTTPGL